MNSDIRCNLCGKPFDLWDQEENLAIDHVFGWGSKYDLQHITMHFCCSCFDKILDELQPHLAIPWETSELVPLCQLSDEETKAIYREMYENGELTYIPWLKPSDRVFMNDRYAVSEKNKGKVFTVISEPWDLCGTPVVALDGIHGGYAIDGLTKIQEGDEAPHE